MGHVSRVDLRQLLCVKSLTKREDKRHFRGVDGFVNQETWGFAEQRKRVARAFGKAPRHPCLHPCSDRRVRGRPFGVQAGPSKVDVRRVVEYSGDKADRSAAGPAQSGHLLGRECAAGVGSHAQASGTAERSCMDCTRCRGNNLGSPSGAPVRCNMRCSHPRAATETLAAAAVAPREHRLDNLASRAGARRRSVAATRAEVPAPAASVRPRPAGRSATPYPPCTRLRKPRIPRARAP